MKTVLLKERLFSVVVLIAGLAVATAGVGPAEAQADTRVSLRLTAPSGHPGAIIVGALFTKDAIVVGEFTGTLAVSGGSASVSLSVTEAPNSVEVDYAIPFNGIQTTYDISPTDFDFDTRYFLPNPSPGGVIAPDTTGDPTIDAFLVVSVAAVSDDTVPPTCAFKSSDPLLIDATVQDVDSGLAKIVISSARNVVVEIPDFAQSTTEPVVVSATVVDPDRSSILALTVFDQAGNRVYCKHYQRRQSTLR